jgi:hypothetical protein
MSAVSYVQRTLSYVLGRSAGFNEPKESSMTRIRHNVMYNNGGKIMKRALCVSMILFLLGGILAGCPSSTPVIPTITDFAINNGDISTNTPSVTLIIDCTGIPTDYMTSESPSFSGASWQTYSTSPSFTLSSGNGVKIVYVKVKNESGESTAVSDTITLNEISPSIENDWGGYWWYQGTEGDVYITWNYHAGQFTTTIPSASWVCKGTYTVDDTATPKTIDVTITESNTPGFVVGKTYRGYYEFRSSKLYRSQMFETRPTWSSSLLDPDTGIVFVADPI